MKRGDIVTIYEDPITCQKPEAKAKLVMKHFDMNDNCEYWTVKFIDDKYGGKYERIIKRTTEKE